MTNAHRYFILVILFVWNGYVYRFFILFICKYLCRFTCCVGMVLISFLLMFICLFGILLGMVGMMDYSACSNWMSNIYGDNLIFVKFEEQA